MNKGPAFALLLLIVLSVLFFRSTTPNQVMFSNDAPLGSMNAERSQVRDSLYGVWDDLNWLGGHAAMPGPSISEGFKAWSGVVPVAIPLLGLFLLWLTFTKRNPRTIARGSLAVFCFGTAGLIAIEMIFKPWPLEQVAGMGSQGLLFSIIVYFGFLDPDLSRDEA